MTTETPESSIRPTRGERLSQWSQRAWQGALVLHQHPLQIQEHGRGQTP